MGYLLSFTYGVVLACSELSFDHWQFWAFLVLYFASRILGYYEGTQA